MCNGEDACYPLWTGLFHRKDRSGQGGKEEFSQEGNLPRSRTKMIYGDEKAPG